MNYAFRNYTIQMINELLKSEEGKLIEIDVERDNKTYKFKFELKSKIKLSCINC